MMSTFDHNANRDAWKTIRGFYYQMQVTILRWLDLDDTGVLMCECGEDIDHIASAFGPQTPEARLLEAVKHREANLSLASIEIREALGNFLEHRSSNPDTDLRMRFTTNTGSAMERGVAFPRDLHGMEAWQAIAVRAYDDDEAAAALGAVRAVLEGQPERRNGSKAERYLAGFLRDASDQELQDTLVGRVEWSLGNPDVRSSEEQMRSCILSLGLAQDYEEAGAQTNRLLAYLIRKLSQRGPKLLSRADLAQVLSGPEEADLAAWMRKTSQVAVRFEAMLGRISEQCADLQEGQRALQEGLGNGFTALAGLISERGSSGIRAGPGPPPMDGAPLVPPLFAERRLLTEGLRSTARGVRWLALCGVKGMGKTQLARAILADSPTSDQAWIAMAGAQAPVRDYVERRAVGWLSRVCSRAEVWQGYMTGAVSALDAVGAMSAGIPSGESLVVDDLPEFLEQPQIADLLIALARALAAKDGLLLTTSNYRAATRAKEHLGESFCEIAVPYFDELETREFLLAAGLPAGHPVQALVATVLAGTGGHPQLVAAHVAWLQRNGWPLGLGTMTNLLQGLPAEDVQRDTVRLAYRLVGDDMSRTLLDRLSLVIGSFDQRVVHFVADVRPPVVSPMPRLEELNGPWVEQLLGGQYRVVQLLHNAGKAHLTDVEQVEVHRAIVGALLRESIDVEQVNTIAGHMAAGRMWPELVNLTVRALDQVTTPEEARLMGWMVHLFPGNSDWSDMGVGTAQRVLLRALQMRTALAGGQDASQLRADFDEMLTQCDDASGLDYVGGLVMVSLLDHGLMPRIDAARYALRAVRLIRRLPICLLEGFPQPPEAVLLYQAYRLHTSDEILGFVGVLRELTPAEIPSMLAYELAPSAVRVLADKVWIAEAQKAESDQDWEQALAVLDALATIGNASDGEWFAVCAARAKAVVLADHLSRVSDARDLLDSTRVCNEDQAFLIEFTRASSYLDEGEVEAAFISYGAALAHQGEQFADLRFEALRRLAESAARLERWSDAQAAATKAHRFACDSVDELDRIEMLGELAWYHWCSGDSRRVYIAMQVMANGLYRLRERDDARFREVFAKAGHVRGWLVGAMSGKPPETTIEGEAYGAPYVGLFSRRRSKMAEAGVPFSQGTVFLQQGMLAQTLGLLGRARACYTLTLRLFGEEGDDPATALASGLLAPLVAATGAFSEALRLALEGEALPSVVQQTGAGERSVLCRGGDLRLGGSGDGGGWHKTILFHWLIGPAFAGLMARRLRDDEACAVVEGWRGTMQQHAARVRDPQYWERLLDLILLAFVEGREEELFCSATPADPNIYTVAYLGYAHRPSVPVARAAAVHAAVFVYHAKTSAGFAHVLAAYVVRYWRQVSEEQAFKLHAPRLLRETLAGLDGGTSVCAAAAVLLAAEAACGASYPEEVRTALTALRHTK